MTLNRPTPSLMILHQAVPGRVRVAVPGLRGEAARARAFEAIALTIAGIRGASVRVASGHALVLFDATFAHDAIAARLAAVWASQAVEVSAPISSVPHEGPVPPGRSEWHALEPAVVAQRLHCDPSRGLSQDDAQDRLIATGRNALPRDPGRSELAILLTQFQSLPVVLLMGSAVLSVATGGIADAAITLAVVTVNGAIGFATERRAERTIHALADPGRHTACVRRDGSEHEISAEEVVPGDVLILQPGSFVPADARVIYSHGLAIDESSLTGESVPVQKSAAAVSDTRMPLADRVSMVYMGTIVTGGSGVAIAVATGLVSEIGQIQSLAGAAQRPETPVERELDQLGRQMVLLCAAACAGVFAIGLGRGQSQLAMLKSAIALAVAAIPEGLPAIATTTLALGVTSMRRQGVLVRRLEAIETLGALEVICFDKTGTLTENRMEAVAVHADDRTWNVVDGKLDGFKDVAALPKPLRHLLEVAALCNEASVDDAVGSETERALIRLAAHAGIDVAQLRGQRPCAGPSTATNTAS